MKKILFTTAIAASATVLTVIIMIMNIPTFSIGISGHALAVGSGTTNNQTSPPSTTSAMNQLKGSDIVASSSNKTFYLFTTEVPGFRETEGVKEAGLPSDQFSLQTILVRMGDRVSVHFYNLDTTDRHTFTIDGPYNVNIDTAPGQNATANFVADHVGIFGFYCKYHPPSMVGQLEVFS